MKYHWPCIIHNIYVAGFLMSLDDNWNYSLKLVQLALYNVDANWVALGCIEQIIYVRDNFRILMSDSVPQTLSKRVENSDQKCHQHLKIRTEIKSLAKHCLQHHCCPTSMHLKRKRSTSLSEEPWFSSEFVFWPNSDVKISICSISRDIIYNTLNHHVPIKYSPY